MRVRTDPWDPPRRYLRLLAWVVAALLAVLAWGLGGPALWPLHLAAGLVFALGTVLPRLFRWPYIALVLGPAAALRRPGRVGTGSGFKEPSSSLRSGSPEPGAAQAWPSAASGSEAGRPPPRL